MLDDARVLRHAYRLLAGDVRRGAPIAPAAEWLLDNFHLVEGEIREIRHHLPTRYYRELPKLPHASSPARHASTPWRWSCSATATRGSTLTG